MIHGLQFQLTTEEIRNELTQNISRVRKKIQDEKRRIEILEQSGDPRVCELRGGIPQLEDQILRFEKMSEHLIAAEDYQLGMSELMTLIGGPNSPF